MLNGFTIQIKKKKIVLAYFLEIVQKYCPLMKQNEVIQFADNNNQKRTVVPQLSTSVKVYMNV